MNLLLSQNLLIITLLDFMFLISADTMQRNLLSEIYFALWLECDDDVIHLADIARFIYEVISSTQQEYLVFSFSNLSTLFMI